MGTLGCVFMESSDNPVLVKALLWISRNDVKLGDVKATIRGSCCNIYTQTFVISWLFNLSRLSRRVECNNFFSLCTKGQNLTVLKLALDLTFWSPWQQQLQSSTWKRSDCVDPWPSPLLNRRIWRTATSLILSWDTVACVQGGGEWSQHVCLWTHVAPVVPSLI